MLQGQTDVWPHRRKPDKQVAQFLLCSYRARTMQAPAPIPDDPELKAARGVARGICRLFARNDIWCMPEMPLRNARRADLMGIDAKGHLIIVEIKVSRADLLGDAKWGEYLDYCDRFYWGLAPHLDRACMDGPAFLPERCGLIVADAYDAEVLRPAPLVPLNAARRKAETERLARAALRRSLVLDDPQAAQLNA